MKKNLIIFLFVIAVITALGVAIAKKPTTWEDYAYGTIETYTEAYSAEIVPGTGYWNLKISDDKIHFSYGYLELNLDEDIENSPVASIDEMSFTNIGSPMYYMYDEDENMLFMFLQIQVKKEWAMFDGSYTHKTWKTWQGITIDFDLNTLHIDSYPPEGDDEPPVVPSDPDTWDWDKEGTVLVSSY